MRKVYIDFETYGRLDLKKVGAYKYANDPDTGIHCIVHSVPDLGGATQTLDSFCGSCPSCDRLKSYAADPNTIFVAHNAFFEQCIWQAILVNRYGYSRIPIERWRCTMAKSLAHGLPAALGDAGEALSLPIQKDPIGHKIMLKLAKYRKDGRPWVYSDCPEEFEKLYAYCTKDVMAEECLDKRLNDLIPSEQKLWFVDQAINFRGVHMDVPSIRAAIKMGEQHARHLENEMHLVTGGVINNPRQRAKVRLWAQDNGVAVDDTRRTTLTTLLDKQSANVPEHVQKAFQTMLEANKTSLAKYKSILARVDEQGVLRENYRFHGAHTGRWTGNGPQLHNLPRASAISKASMVIEALQTGGYDWFSMLYPDVSTTLSQAIRAMVIAPGNSDLLIADYAQIEARILAWLARQEDKLELFRKGEDVYCRIATATYGYPVEKHMPERQTGKVQDLALGYEGGISAVATFALAYGLDLEALYRRIYPSTTQSERGKAEYAYEWYISKAAEPVSKEAALVADILKQRWRAANPKIVEFWRLIEATAIKAYTTGQVWGCGRLVWFMDDIFLYCKLPSGRCLAYPYPKVKEDANGNRKLSYYGKIEGTNKWGRIGTYGGRLTENVVQGIGRDIESDSLVRLDSMLPANMHTHDDIVSCGHADVGRFSDMVVFKSTLSQPPKWATDLPIKIDAYSSKRYGVKS